jgi:EAL and modified HD-GYP domain-containing signal transduction protein
VARPVAAQDTAPPASAAASPATCLQRQPVLDRAERVVAYRLGTVRERTLRISEWRPSTRRLFDALLLEELVRSRIGPLLARRRVVLPVGSGIVDHPLIEHAARENVVVHVTWHDVSGATPGDTLTHRLARLREIGVRVACTHALLEREPESAAWDHLTVDVGSVDPARLLDVVRGLGRRGRDRAPWATNVQSLESYQACRELGFAWFHGDFVGVMRERDQHMELPPYRLAAVQMMNAIRSEAGLERAWADPTLVLRLLRYVNSPAVGLRTPVRDLRHAIAFLGYDELYRWVTLLLFAVHRGGERDPMEHVLRESSLVRARLMEQLGAVRLAPRECGQLFVTGVLSSIDLLLGAPMREALARFNLPAEVAQALVHGNGPYGPYLDAALACERDDQRSIAALAGDCGVDPGTVNRLHLAALEWMLELAADE